MPETNKTPLSHHFHFGTPLSLAVLSVLLGLVFPPLGLLFALAAIYRAGQTNSKKVLVVAAVGIAVAIAASVIYGYAYYQRQSDPNVRSYTYSNFEATTIGDADDPIISFTKPANMQVPKDFFLSTSQFRYAHPVAVHGYPSKLAAATLSGTVFSPAQKYDKKYIDQINNLMSANGQKTDEYATFKNSVANYLKRNLNINAKVELSAPVAFTNANIKENAWQYGYDAKIVNDNGSEIEYRGKLIYIVGKDNSFYVNMNALVTNWNDNLETWKTIQNSLKAN
jgi:hypothetical protein